MAQIKSRDNSIIANYIIKQRNSGKFAQMLDVTSSTNNSFRDIIELIRMFTDGFREAERDGCDSVYVITSHAAHINFFLKVINKNRYPFRVFSGDGECLDINSLEQKSELISDGELLGDCNRIVGGDINDSYTFVFFLNNSNKVPFSVLELDDNGSVTNIREDLPLHNNFFISKELKPGDELIYDITKKNGTISVVRKNNK